MVKIFFFFLRKVLGQMGINYLVFLSLLDLNLSPHGSQLVHWPIGLTLGCKFGNEIECVRIWLIWIVKLYWVFVLHLLSLLSEDICGMICGFAIWLVWCCKYSISPSAFLVSMLLEMAFALALCCNYIWSDNTGLRELHHHSF